MRLHDWVSVTRTAWVTKSGVAHEWMECHLHHLVFPPRTGEQPRRSASHPRCVRSSSVASARTKKEQRPHRALATSEKTKPQSSSASSRPLHTRSPRAIFKNGPRLIFSSAFPSCAQPTGMRCIEVARLRSLVSQARAGPGITSGERAGLREHACANV